MEFLILFVTLAIGVKLGWDARERHATRVLDRFMENLQEEIEEEDNRIFIEIEQHSGSFYVFNKITKEFMAQGKTRMELEETLAKRFPGKKFAASAEVLRTLHNENA